ncbi:hypothetical protein ONS95_003102 [Cadophora gregata]|uniref:uncharacterized protein n=1 Tax=Cadophora gregata TaxID=51156 RepID=UPI0026DAD6C5|nr:uncharacterized protein ONS95_003102 [Cadophora gregata]KAK0108286.1 hypothetical protein ONS95_003102 [Cadophora gregata]KAK0109122.1 hypothetical protein ONS96_002949 [Cadophora gregata f. sp. sojae]
MPSTIPPLLKQPKIILFDLDSTLFSHTHSLICALTAIQTTHPLLSTIPLLHLRKTYNASLQTTYNQYLTHQITFPETHALKIKLFYNALDLPAPSSEQVQEFRDVYKEAYRVNRVATDGSWDVLKRLRKMGWKVGIVTNGQAEEQEEKARVIGVRELVDCLITSEEVGVCKPDRRIFERAVEIIGGSSGMRDGDEGVEEEAEVWMVGDDVEADVKGALGVGFKAVLYEDGVEKGSKMVDGKQVDIIGRMHELLELLGLT